MPTEEAHQETEEEIEIRFKVTKALGHQDLNLLHRVCDLEEDVNTMNDLIKAQEAALAAQASKISKLEAFGQVTNTRLTEARAVALDQYFKDMKAKNTHGEKFLNSPEIVYYFENLAPDYLRIWNIKNPWKTAADVRSRCIKKWPDNYSKSKSKFGKGRWVLHYKE